MSRRAHARCGAGFNRVQCRLRRAQAERSAKTQRDIGGATSPGSFLFPFFRRRRPLPWGPPPTFYGAAAHLAALLCESGVAFRAVYKGSSFRLNLRRRGVPFEPPSIGMANFVGASESLCPIRERRRRDRCFAVRSAQGSRPLFISPQANALILKQKYPKPIELLGIQGIMPSRT